MPIPAGANVPWYLDKALDRTKNFVSINAGQATFAQIQAEVDAGRPIGARIGWSGGGGHFMVIYGYSTWFGEEYVDIDDPIYGKSHLTLVDFSTNYQGSGTWTHYYITKSYRKWWWPDVVIPEYLFKKIWQARQVMLLKGVADPDTPRGVRRRGPGTVRAGASRLRAGPRQAFVPGGRRPGAGGPAGLRDSPR